MMFTRDPINFADLKRRDAITQRVRKFREEVQLDINTIEHWNRTHPEEPPFSTDYERAVLAWCDGLGPMPETPRP